MDVRKQIEKWEALRAEICREMGWKPLQGELKKQRNKKRRNGNKQETKCLRNEETKKRRGSRIAA